MPRTSAAPRLMHCWPGQTKKFCRTSVFSSENRLGVWGLVLTCAQNSKLDREGRFHTRLEQVIYRYPGFL
jgi:hypothetical protein